MPNKCDALSIEDITLKQQALEKESQNKKIYVISAISGENINIVLHALFAEIKAGKL